MSYLDDSLVVNYRNKVVSTEIRTPKSYGLRELFQKQTDQMKYMNSDLKKYVRDYASGNSIQLPSLTEDVITTSSSESFTIPANLSTSAMTSLTFTTITAGYAIYPDTFKNNVISEEKYQMNKIKECDMAMAKALEDYLDTHLDTYKTQTWTGDSAISGYSFNTTTDALDVSLDAQNDIMFASINTMAESNDWDSDMLDMAMNPTGGHVLNQWLKYGSNNEKNLGVQNIPNIYTSNRVTNTSGKRWTGYLMNSGAVGMLPNYMPTFQDNVTVGEAKWGISSVALPQLGYKVMMYENKEKVDASSVGTYASHAKMSYKKEYLFVFKFTLLRTYNSAIATRVADILKINASLT